MTNIKVEWLERKTVPVNGSNKTIYDVKLDDGTEATIWEFDKDGVRFPGFDEIVPGSTIDGNLWKNPKNGMFTIYPVKEKKSFTPKPSVTKEAMETKRRNIEEAQENKQEAIKVSSTLRDAVLLTTSAGVQGISVIEIQSRILEWRRWLWQHWNDPEEYPPFV